MPVVPLRFFFLFHIFSTLALDYKLNWFILQVKYQKDVPKKHFMCAVKHQEESPTASGEPDPLVGFSLEA